MSATSSASCALSTQTSCQPRSRTASASLCSTPNAPGSSRARLPTIATIGMRSAGVTVSASIAYPADAGRSGEDARSAGAGVLDDLELRVLALGDDVLAIHLTVGDQLRHVLHHRVVGPDGIGGDDVDVGELARHRDRLAARDERRL